VISRRTFLAGSAALTVLAACGGDDGGGGGTGTDSTSTTTEEPVVPTVFGAGFADGYAAKTAIVAGIPQRLPFVALSDIGEVARGEEAPESVDVEVLFNGAAVATLAVPRHDAGIPTPYYPVVFTPPAPGDYTVKASFAAKATPFKVAAPTDLTLLQVGQPMRPVVTPTTADARGVTPICTRPDPCPFHAVTLADALAAAKPVALIVSTPGYCQTAICGPVLELLMESAAANPDVTYVHAEVYQNPQSGKLDTTEIITAYGLSYEPALFVADATGALKARLDFSWDRTELDAALATV
jgi:hypothetical protein